VHRQAPKARRTGLATPWAGLDDELNWRTGSSALCIVIENQSQKENVNKKSAHF
jgi:hypothetical protein